MEDDFQKEGNAATLALQTIPTPPLARTRQAHCFNDAPYRLDNLRIQNSLRRKLQPLWNATSHCDEFYQLHHSLQLVPHL